MPALVINAPREQVDAGFKKSFDSTMRTGVGEGYAISRTLYDQCRPGMVVVLLSKDEGKRAEGRLIRLVPGEKAGNGIQRYDVHVEGLAMVKYKPEALNRNGVAVIGDL